VLGAKIPGEMPPPAPRACFGRDELIKEIIGLAENLEPMALIGAGGIGKTSIALTVLHDNRMKRRFGENRRFIRCDQFPATLPHFLNRLSEATGAGVENPDDLTPLLPFLSSKEMFIVLDNAESILDPQGTNAQDIYSSVEELCQLDTICVCITSRISTVPPDYETLDVPTLPMEAARDVFYRIYEKRGRSGLVDDILKQLEFHPLSVTLLATVAQQNRWDTERLMREWKRRRTDTLETDHRTSLATTIELSLTSPTFKELGPDARGLLGVIAFYPQGIDENNADLLFPTISSGTYIFDKFCILSLTYRSNGFITMLAPLRDHLCPKDPVSSPLLCTTKEFYFARMAISLDPRLLGFGDGRWILSEDVNVEHLLDVFASVNPDSDNIWGACTCFISLLLRHKPRKTILKKRVEELPDNHYSKPGCLFVLGLLSPLIGNYEEAASLLNHALKLERERGDNKRVAQTLWQLATASRWLGRYEEGIHHAREALEISERLGRAFDRAGCLNALAKLLKEDGQLDAAAEAMVESMKFLSETGKQDLLYGSHYILGDIYCSKGDKEKAVHHYEVALRIAATFPWRGNLFLLYLSLAEIFLNQDEFDCAEVHIEQAKSHALDNPYNLGRAAHLQAVIWYKQHRFEDATSEVLRAQEIFEKLGNVGHLEGSRALLRTIEAAMKILPSSGE
jgi:tetratricopeptide (TPR) repeat protein